MDIIKFIIYLIKLKNCFNLVVRLINYIKSDHESMTYVDLIE